jgi:hypothetical protein
MDAFSSNKFMQECKKANTVVGKVTFEQKKKMREHFFRQQRVRVFTRNILFCV